MSFLEVTLKNIFNTCKIAGQVDWLGPRVWKNGIYDIKYLIEEISVSFTFLWGEVGESQEEILHARLSV